MTDDGLYNVEKVVDLIPEEYPEYNDLVAGLRRCAERGMYQNHLLCN